MFTYIVTFHRNTKKGLVEFFITQKITQPHKWGMIPILGTLYLPMEPPPVALTAADITSTMFAFILGSHDDLKSR